MLSGPERHGDEGPVWEAVKARDSVGSTWGPTETPAANSGLIRYPHATRWGWNSSAAARVTVPVLVMHGTKDTTINVGASAKLYSELTAASSRTIHQPHCASHSIFWEACSGPTCNGSTGPHMTVRKNILDWMRTGFIYASPGITGAFSSTPDGTNYHLTTPINDGPPADESNLTP